RRTVWSRRRTGHITTRRGLATTRRWYRYCAPSLDDAVWVPAFAGTTLSPRHLPQLRLRDLLRRRARHVVDETDLARHLEVGEAGAAGGHHGLVQIGPRTGDAIPRDDEDDRHLVQHRMRLRHHGGFAHAGDECDHLLDLGRG